MYTQCRVSAGRITDDLRTDRFRSSAVALEESVESSYITNSSNVECMSLSSDEEMAGEGSAGLGIYSRSTTLPIVTPPTPPRMTSPTPQRMRSPPTPPSYSPIDSPIGTVEKLASE